MKRGFRIADAYVEIHADESDLQKGIRDLPATMGADADRAGQALGDKLTKGLAAKVEALSGRVASARLQEKKAADAVTLAESKLNQARSQGVSDGTKLMKLEQDLSQAQDKLSVAHDRAAKATKAHSDAEKLLGRAIDDVGKKAGREAEKAGEDAGSKLAMGMQMAFVKDSPLIAAAVAGVLIAGAPLLLAAAGLLFGGIGALVLKNNAVVKASYGDLWDHVKQQTTASAQSLVPVLTGVATSLGHSFDRMQPLLTQAFAASGPLIDKTVTGIEQLAQNALPGMVHAVQAGGPVFTGFQNFLASTGSGLGKFFDIIAQHGPASGQVFTALGSIVQSLLQILGDFAGQGAEIGSVVLPMLASALKIVADILHVIAPVLPLVVAGFSGFRLASMAAGYVSTFGKQLQFVGGVAGPVGGVLTGAGKAVSALGSALPVLGIGLGLLTMGFNAQGQAIDGWVAGLMKGGTAADQATAAMNRQEHAGLGVSDWLDRAKGLWNDGIAQLKGYSSASDEVHQKLKDQLAAMDPLTRAQTLQTQAQNDLADAIGKYGPASSEAAAAADRYNAKSAEVTRLQDQESMAIKGVTQAMVDQANQILAQTDASLALAKGSDEVTKLASAAAAAIVKYGKGSNQAAIAQDNLTNGLQAQVHLLETYATSSVPKSLDALDAGQLAAFRMADGLNAMHAKYGDLGAAMEKERADLNAQVGLYDRNRVEAAALTAAFKDTGLAVDNIPGTKEVQIHAPTLAVVQELKTLGFTITTLPNGDVTVSAETDKAKGNLNALAGYINQVGGMKPSVTPQVNPGPAIGNTRMVMDNLSAMGGMRPTAVADVNTSPARGNYDVMMGMLGVINGQRPNPIANLGWSTWGAENALNYAARTRYSTIVVSAQAAAGSTAARNYLYGGATGGQVGAIASGLAGQRFDRGGKIVGPGGGRDDLVQAVTDGGRPLRVSNLEWIVNAAAARAQGDRKMSLLNAGKATIVPTGGQRPSTSGSPMSSTNPTSGSAPVGDSGGMHVVVQNLTVAVQGILDLTDPASARRIAEPIRDAIVRLERQTR